MGNSTGGGDDGISGIQRKEIIIAWRARKSLIQICQQTNLDIKVVKEFIKFLEKRRIKGGQDHE